MRYVRAALLIVGVAALSNADPIFISDNRPVPSFIVPHIEDETDFEDEIIDPPEDESDFLPIPDSEIVEVTYEDAQILMRIAAAEAGTEGIDGKAYVMAVVLNRVNDDSGNFPDTVEEVVFQNNQFSTIKDGSYDAAKIDTECHLALAEIEMGLYNDFPALYFDSCKDSWASKHREFYKKIGNHNFYL